MGEPTQEPLSPLSASKVKVLENCSWLYWSTYHLKLPQVQNDGARKGNVCHSIFEILLNKKHIPLVKKVTKAGTVTVSKALERLIKKYIRTQGLPDHSAVFLQIDQMLLVGLKSDFYVQGGVLVSPEYKFDLIEPSFRIKGFMDKPVIKGDTIIIDDFKSAKEKFKGEDEESNLQALFYSYAARKIWPNLKPIVRFIFLQYPEDPMMVAEFSDDALKGFEMYLSQIQKRVNIFNENSAKSSFAADQEQHDGGFNGKLLCGYAKQPNQLKKDGTKMWHCSYKFPFDYYVIKKAGKIVYTVFKEEQIKPLKDGETVEKMRYDGCPKFRNAVDDLHTSKAEPPKKYVNVLDDF
jgi:hypothetical protein